eukprot:GHVN01025455.1.p2 GENE.GHVN01025455.1~~GHVN01025455.1.p2  ORF type:complete len:160 (-),score=22.38 GHVN01025455.1:1180-1659(-)
MLHAPPIATSCIKARLDSSSGLQVNVTRCSFHTLSQHSGVPMKKNPALQVDLVMSALRRLRKGGEIIYSTCALSHHENDEVIRKVLKAARGTLTVIPVVTKQLGDLLHINVGPMSKQKIESSLASTSSFITVEATEFGVMVLPDVSGYGPQYIARLTNI